jgi:hypothetical protein
VPAHKAGRDERLEGGGELLRLLLVLGDSHRAVFELEQ